VCGRYPQRYALVRFHRSLDIIYCPNCQLHNSTLRLFTCLNSIIGLRCVSVSEQQSTLPQQTATGRFRLSFQLLEIVRLRPKLDTHEVPLRRLASLSSFKVDISWRSMTLNGQVSQFPPLRMAGTPMSSKRSSTNWGQL